MPIPYLHKPTHYLKQLGKRRASHDLWAEYLAATGFTIEPVDDSHSAICSGATAVAKVEGTYDSIVVLNEAAIAAVEAHESPITGQQRALAEQAFFKIDRDAIAVHEAGHAVAAHALGRKFCYVRLSPTGSAMGWCSDDGPDSLEPYDNLDDINKVQTVMAAGAAAEELISGWHRVDAAANDRMHVNLIEYLRQQFGPEGPPEDEPDVFDEYVAKAAATLDKDKVNAVADALKVKGFLSRGDIGRIMERVES